MSKRYSREVKIVISISFLGILIAGIVYGIHFLAVSREIDEFDRKMKEFQRNRASGAEKQVS